MHPTIASLNSLAEVLKNLQPLQSECSLILRSLEEPATDQSAPDSSKSSASTISSSPRLTIPTGQYRLRRFLASIDREELYEKLWAKPFRLVASEYGLSFQQLRRLCGYLSVPAPHQGFWSTKKAGRPLRPIPPLPPFPSNPQPGSVIASDAEPVAFPAIPTERSDGGVGTDDAPRAHQMSLLHFPDAHPLPPKAPTLERPTEPPVPSALHNGSLAGREPNNAPPAKVVPNGVGSGIAQKKSFAISTASAPKRTEFAADPNGQIAVRIGSELVVPRGLVESSRYNREQLYEDVWSSPMTMLSKKYGVSDRAIGKACRRLHVPVPSIGHWNKIAAHKPGDEKPPLPKVSIAPLTMRRKPRVHSREEANSIVQKIDNQWSSGTTLNAACAALGISESTYWRWKSCRRQTDTNCDKGPLA